MNHLRFALRQLAKSPAFTAIAVLTLGLGIGANTAIFSVVNAVLLRPLPYPDWQRLMLLSETSPAPPEISVSFQNYLDYRRDNTVFQDLAIARRESYNLSGLDGRVPEQVDGALVTANFFKVIGLMPQLGRTFTDDEDKVGGPALAVISDKLWQRVFNRDPGVIGRAVNFGNQPYTVIGVMPAEMFSPRAVEVWFPIMRRTSASEWQPRDNHQGLFGWGRLKDGVSLETAQAQMTTIAQRLAIQYPKTNATVGTKLEPFFENQVGSFRTSLRLLLAAVIVVLLIACANLANLLAARGAARQREFAIRIAIGASRRQIMGQLLVESVLLAIVGGALGVVLAAWGRDILVAMSPQTRRFQETRIDVWVLLFTFTLSVGTSLLFGLWPAWQASRADAQSALSAGARGSSDAPAARRSREILVIAEVALTLLLLSAAGLVLKSFAKAASLQLGFEPKQLVTAQLFLPSPTDDDETRLTNFTDALLDKLRAIPGVNHASVAANPPLLNGWQTGFLPEGMEEPPSGQRPMTEVAVITPDYFATIGTSLLRGRAFTPDDKKDSSQVVIIDQSIADKFFPNQDPVGKHLRMQTQPDKPGIREIVGVAPRLKIYGYDESQSGSLGQVYLPQAQQPQTGLVVLLRTSLPAASLEKTLRQIVASLDPSQPLFDLKTMQERVEETWATPRLMSFLLGSFAALALVLAVVGLYGVVSYNGVRRMREIGVRLALGAQRHQIVALMLRQGVRLLAIGLLVGFVGTIATSRVLQSVLYSVSTLDATIYAGVSVLLAAAAILACWLPARRAARVDPIVTLRAE